MRYIYYIEWKVELCMTYVEKWKYAQLVKYSWYSVVYIDNKT